MAQSEQIKALLHAHHERFTGSTGRLFSAFLSDAGLTSYATLAAVLDVRAGQSVLDIGCGDGVLLASIFDREPGVSLHGLDASGAELALARERVPGAALVQGDCTERLPYPDAVFDAVASHLVLMLVGDIETTFAEVRRVAKPGAAFAFIYDDLASDADGVYADLMRTGVVAGLGESPSHFRQAADPRLYDHEALRELCARHDLEIAEHRRFRVSREITCDDDAWALLATSYPLGRLDDEARARARTAVLGRFRERFGASAAVALPLQLIKAYRAS